ncbi:hydroxymethylbilane synthase [Dermacoccus nishinomiyaensis]|uniref:hydroxymethylbilane synthase n=1 Tax=Dermacoccus TaxID=57495 RepID=UPI000783CF48|nr:MULTISPECIES: hydroxymethylbilane synthase [Dermacoccus]MCI0153528.1 hydroxymethylbilane synthase [Dermacoccus nishinomiyaensis]PZP03948.1 MAG: hydroxymethylbilane synthase [Dermacoccus nishinomiyaensis]QQY24508.1 hydroxymethylbilane synthase [Dermacoccus nishinomiyaensis]TJZ96669.1 hydroxymethylbilane synthase [Dermacoccus nishinomiyaensis]STD19856.1 Porphobilinogen deaminase [Dermacoccus nishinomiyaensis]
MNSQAADAAPIRLGTRRSHLAMTQSTWVAEQLRAHGHAVEIVEITTEGDVNRASLAQMGGTGVFAAAIRRALLEDEVDMAVHSLKDLPVAPEPGLVIAGIPVREDPRDALVARDGLTLGELPAGAVVGTGSPRRAAQLQALGLGFEIRDIRGNIDTRMGYVTSGELDGVILARAGLTRVERTGAISETIDPLQMLPAPGQGALGLECREGDARVIAALAELDDADTRAAVTAERAVLGALEAGCAAPVGALAEIVEEPDGSLEISLRAFVGAPDGSFELRRSDVGSYDNPAAVGEALARTLLDDGAGAVIPPREAPNPTTSTKEAGA